MQKIQKQQASTKCKNTKTQGKMQKNQKSTPHRKKSKPKATKCKKIKNNNFQQNAKKKHKGTMPKIRNLKPPNHHGDFPINPKSNHGCNVCGFIIPCMKKVR